MTATQTRPAQSSGRPATPSDDALAPIRALGDWEQRVAIHYIVGYLSGIVGPEALAEAVAAALLIGRSGSTGNSTGPHVHFELKGGNGHMLSGPDDPGSP